jgi:hypothetical protein
MTTSERSETLQNAAERAAIRLQYCRREYDRAVTTLDPTNPQHARVLSKLAEDLHRAETDVGWTQRRLDEAGRQLVKHSKDQPTPPVAAFCQP